MMASSISARALRYKASFSLADLVWKAAKTTFICQNSALSTHGLTERTSFYIISEASNEEYLSKDLIASKWYFTP